MMLCRKVATLFGILIISLLTIGITGPAMSFFLVDFHQALDDSSAATIGLTQSLYFGAVSIFGPLVVIVSKKLGERETIIAGCVMVSGGLMVTSQTNSVCQLFIAYSFISGIGTSLIITSTVFIIGHHFSRSAAVYFGFLFAGSALGLLITPIFCAEIKLLVGFRGTILILGALSMHSIPISFLIFKKYSKKRSKLSDNNETDSIVAGTTSFTSNTDENVTTTKTSKINDFQPKGNFDEEVSIVAIFFMYPNLILLGIIRALAEYAYVGFFVHFIASVIYKGISERNAAFALASFGIGSFTGRLTAFVPEHLHIMKKSNAFTTAMLIIGTLTIVFDFIRSVYFILITAALIGYFVGWYLILFPGIVRDSVCKERFKEVYGFINVPAGVVCTFSGFTVGWIYDVSGLYKLSFFMAGGIFIFNGLMMFLRDLAMKYNHEANYRGAETVPELTV